ncbi:transglycosylase domain-containing protein [Egicoccus halophilus]|uniref:Penicillin-binding protein n=1 Tax=Egicoccus halophilus TaxID=1670830 RepID=A0A8J3EST4_9ACTN|nr:transglycosylase domain-containing protein [Egicoccus halophilus]GGI08110.1 penicillin-binding protein [Egicoccus halophilus]
MSFQTFGRGLRSLTGVLVVVFVLGLLALAPVMPFVIAAADTVDATRDQVVDRPPLPEQLPVAAEISTVHEAGGERIADLSGVERREVVALEQIPQVMIDAVLAIEDDEFYEHNGVNHQSVLRALARNVAAGGIEEGASTITQQYVKMTLLDPQQTLDRKMHEVVWAVELEQRLSKDEILERYLNAVYLGQGVYGVGTAAEHYFNKPVEDLTLAEAATLAGTIQAPSVTNPVSNAEAAERRRNVVLSRMQFQGMIDAEQVEQARTEGIELDIRSREVAEPFWIDYVKRLVYDQNVTLQPGLQEAVGATRDERIDALFEGGLRIYTTLDPAMHAQASETLSSYLDDPVEDPLGSLITIEHESGALRALALGPRQFGACPEDADDDEPCVTTQVNPAMPDAGGSGRQPGSAFKPIVAAAALQDGVQFEDEYDTPSGEPVEGCGDPGEDYEPRNFDGADTGEMDLVEAMRTSNNVYFVKLARDLGIDRVVESAREHGIRNAPSLDGFGTRSCSIALGTAEMFPLEVAAAYGVWANDGVYCAPYLIERIENRWGEVVYQHEPRCERVLASHRAGEMRSLLAQPTGSGGTAPVVGRTVGEAYGKTGTTQNFADAWFVGFAGPYSTAAWVGFEQPQPLTDLTIGGTYHERVTGGAVPAPIWADYMAAILDQ